MSLNYRGKQYGGTRKKTEDAGFTLVEVMMVCVIMVIISVIAIPNIVQANATYKLDAAGHSLASLLQQARMQAVKLNQPQYAQYDPNTGVAFVNDGSTAAYTAGNPDVGLTGGLSFQNTAQTTAPDHTQLDTYVGYTAGNTLPVIGGNIGFNARGLPCSANGNPAICPSATGGYEWFVQNGNRGWEAVTVTPAGRIKSWHTSNPTGGSWQ
jgi:prepilin-type N-terminal cleavage/methylation domain-containing protein